ncbi:response regulator [Pannonibacter tanglangensis]|uniref:Response regulator n=1 Tax=Pannonibacter tanglangensis TaxID=2750084 RepID=A0ABW9ZQ30_9HYPH|nr:adenylate/guanylate cyclase domain-containing protein [Pannonibacter sp. XCT-34]NBN65084.1 response regulator [Pannonibacter sp. XCT-34]
MTGRPSSGEAPMRRRILIVDDSFIIRRLVTEIIESDPMLEVAGEAENGKIALQQVRKLNPDLVLLDIEMPEMSGLETLRRLSLRSPCPVIILSSLVGSDESAERLEALRLGAAAIIAKPSGAVSLDLKQKRASEIVTAARRVLGLPPVLAADAPATAPELRADDEAMPPALAADLQGLLDALSGGVLLFGPEGRLAAANPAARAILRMDTLPVGLPLAAFFSDYNEDLAEDLRAVLDGGSPLDGFDCEFATPGGDWVPLRLSARCVAAAAGPTLVVSFQDIGREKELESVLARTQSNPVARILVEHGPEALDGALMPATVLFSDIRNFTSLSEALGARGTVRLLNDYFSFMADVLRDQGGIIDKYIGDAIMALFGVPAPLGNDTDRAVEAARVMMRALALVNDRRRDGLPEPLRIGIGLATGEVLAGNIGSPERMNYTVIGDAANLASRLEAITKSYGVSILACGETVARLSRPVPMRLVDVVRVKGQDRPTEIHEIFVEAPDAAGCDWLDAHASGFSAYRIGAFAMAEAAFARALDLTPGDQASRLLMERCRLLARDSATLTAPWDGIWTLTEK